MKLGDKRHLGKALRKTSCLVVLNDRGVWLSSSCSAWGDMIEYRQAGGAGVVGVVVEVAVEVVVIMVEVVMLVEAMMVATIVMVLTVLLMVVVSW